MHVLCLWLSGFRYGAEVICTGLLHVATIRPECNTDVPGKQVHLSMSQNLEWPWPGWLRTFIDRPARCNLEVTPVTLFFNSVGATKNLHMQNLVSSFLHVYQSHFQIAFLTPCSLRNTLYYRPNAPLSSDIHGVRPRARQTHSPDFPLHSCVMP